MTRFMERQQQTIETRRDIAEETEELPAPQEFDQSQLRTLGEKVLSFKAFEGPASKRWAQQQREELPSLATDDSVVIFPGH